MNIPYNSAIPLLIILEGIVKTRRGFVKMDNTIFCHIGNKVCLCTSRGIMRYDTTVRRNELALNRSSHSFFTITGQSIDLITIHFTDEETEAQVT